LKNKEIEKDQMNFIDLDDMLGGSTPSQQTNDNSNPVGNTGSGNLIDNLLDVFSNNN
jgi:hypothetical protein